jgi:hypothetical protein
MMAVLTGYIYKDGVYFDAVTGAGPYALSSSDTAQKALGGVTYLALPVTSDYVYKHGAYFHVDGSGPHGFE